jgi:hypothetical protein
LFWRKHIAKIIKKSLGAEKSSMFNDHAILLGKKYFTTEANLRKKQNLEKKNLFWPLIIFKFIIA